MGTAPKNRVSQFRRRVCISLNATKRSVDDTRLLNYFLMVLILLNVLAVIAESLASVGQQYQASFNGFKLFSIAVFTLEFLARLWTCVEHVSAQFQHPVWGRLRYFFTIPALLDLFAILPFYLPGLIGMDLRFLRIFRLLDIFRVITFFQPLASVGHVVRRQAHILISILILMIAMMTFASCLVYLVEHQHQPEPFASIPDSMWWTIVTLTTVGYGDVVPVTMVGKIIGGMIMLMGIGMFALPAGVLASAFAEEIRRKNFIVTWNLVASVPFFKCLDAKEIARIADCLQPRTMMPHEVVFHQSEYGESMYFVVAGKVEVEVTPPVMIGKGNFFGEIAILRDGHRTATVASVTYTELLELNVRDFEQILASNPELRKSIEAEASRRLQRTSKQTLE